MTKTRYGAPITVRLTDSQWEVLAYIEEQSGMRPAHVMRLLLQGLAEEYQKIGNAIDGGALPTTWASKIQTVGRDRKHGG
jgi:hypothetical protein